VDRELKEKLLDKRWVGEQLKLFRQRHGFPTHVALQEATGLTGLSYNEQGKQFPSWPALVKIAEACKVDLVALVRFFAPETKQKPEHPLVTEARALASRAPSEADLLVRILRKQP
jgi:transcriptional regulator with XRE-family HTH domain